MTRLCSFVAAILGLAAAFSCHPAVAQDLIADTDAARKEQRETMKSQRVGIVTGGPGGAYIRLGSDLADLVEGTATDIRMIVMRGRGSARNLQELAFLEYTDLALVQADVLQSIEREDPDDYEYLFSRLAYVARFHPEVIHVFGSAAIGSPKSLDGKRIAVDLPGSGTWVTAPVVLDTMLKIRPEFVPMRPADALRDLLSATPTIDAMMFVAGRGAALFKSLNDKELRAVREKDVRFLAFPDAPGPGSPYAQATLTAADYAGLIEAGKPVPVWTVPAVLAVYNWDRKGSQGHRDRYSRVQKFIDVFFANRAKLDDGPGGYDDNWCSIDLAGTVSGWNRFPHADEWLADHAGEETRICKAAALPGCEELFALDMRNLGLDPIKPEVQRHLPDWKLKNGQRCQ